jgi:AcrR family transcriptional regulator
MTRVRAGAVTRAGQAAATREELLTCALRLFASHGVSNTSLDDVARAAAVTKGAIYWHFHNKDELFHAILDRIRARWQAKVLAPVAREMTARARLERLFDGYLALLGESPEMCLFLQQSLMDQDNEAAVEKVSEVYAQTAAFIARILDAGKRDGSFKSNVRVMATATAIVGALSGATQQCLANRRFTMTRAIEELKAMALGRVCRVPGRA